MFCLFVCFAISEAFVRVFIPFWCEEGLFDGWCCEEKRPTPDNREWKISGRFGQKRDGGERGERGEP